jgi:hypothetical protein
MAGGTMGNPNGNFFMAAAFFALALLAAGCAGDASAQAETAPESEGTAGISLAELAKHNTASDCWMAIDGAVADFTNYTIHPDGEGFKEYCGTDATAEYDLIKRGRGHSAYADGLVKEYAIGTLASGG